MPLGNPKARFGAWLRLPKSMVDVDRIRAELTILNPAFAAKHGYSKKAPKDEAEKYIHLFREYDHDPGGLYVPRNYVPKGISKEDCVWPEIRRCSVEWPKDRITLGPNEHQPYDQGPAYDALIEPPNLTKGRLLVLGCGKGKSVISLKAAMKRRVPVGVIVDSNELADQWTNYIVQFCGISETQIGRVQGTKFKWDGYPIVVMMAQTLMQATREWSEEFLNYFGYIIADEVHTLSAPVFSRVISLFTGERLAMTATPVRDDGLDLVFRYHTDDEPCFEDVEQELMPDVFLHPTGEANPDVFIFGPPSWGKDNRRWTTEQLLTADKSTRRMLSQILKTKDVLSGPQLVSHLIRKKKGSIPATLTVIGRNEKRNQKVVTKIQQWAREGRTILALGGRTNQLIWFHDNYPGDSGLCYGKVKKSTRMQQLQGYRVVFAQQNMVLKGLDRKAFDTLVLLSLDPKLATLPNLQQGIGRIQRPLPGKKQTQVHAFVDEQSVLLGPSQRRFVQNAREILPGVRVISGKRRNEEDEEL